MTVFSPSDIKIYYTGASTVGAAQLDPSLSLGGNLSSTEVPNVSLMALFDIISGSETVSGSINYRAVMVKNTNQIITLAGTKIYFLERTGYSDDLIYFGLEDSIGSAIQTITDETTSPTGIVWYYPETVASGIVVGDLEYGECFGVWFKRSFVPTLSGSGQRDDWFTLVIEGNV